MIKQIGVAAALLVSGMGLAYASSDPCADPQVVEQVKEQVICTQIVNCEFYGGWDRVLQMTPEKYRTIHGFKVPDDAMSAAIQKNGFRIFIGLDHVVDHVDTIPVSYEAGVGRYDCRMTIHWNIPVYKTILFSGFWAVIAEKLGATMVVIGSDAGWSFLWNQTGFESRVYPTMNVDYGIVGDRFEITRMSKLFDDNFDH